MAHGARGAVWAQQIEPLTNSEDDVRLEALLRRNENPANEEI